MALTRDQLVTEVLRRLGDTASAFQAVIDPIFDLILGEMASVGALSILNSVNSFNLATDTRDYATLTATGETTPNYPFDVTKLRVLAWTPPAGVLERVPSEVLAYRRLRSDTSGQPSCWCLFPDETNIRIHPKPSSTYNAVAVEIEYVKTPAIITGSTAITEVRFEDLHTFVKGVYVYGVEFVDEPLAEELVADRQKALADWQRGLSIMAQRAKTRLLTPRQRLAVLQPQKG